MKRAHNTGLDVLGAGIGDFIPFMNIASGVMGGFAGGASGGADAQKAAIEKALQEERMRQEAARAQAEAARSRMIMYAVLGTVTVGGLMAVLMMRRK